MKAMILCVPYDEKLVIRNDALGIFKSHAANCARCNEKVLMSDASKKMFDAGEADPVCTSCARADIESQAADLQVTPEHLREVAAYLANTAAQKN